MGRFCKKEKMALLTINKEDFNMDNAYFKETTSVVED